MAVSEVDLGAVDYERNLGTSGVIGEDLLQSDTLGRRRMTVEKPHVRPVAVPERIPGILPGIYIPDLQIRLIVGLGRIRKSPALVAVFHPLDVNIAGWIAPSRPGLKFSPQPERGIAGGKRNRIDIRVIVRFIRQAFRGGRAIVQLPVVITELEVHRGWLVFCPVGSALPAW